MSQLTPFSNTIIKIDTVIANNGRTSATGVMLGLYYPNGNIIKLLFWISEREMYIK